MLNSNSLTLALALFLSGCASSVYVKTETAPNYDVSKKSTLYVLTMESNSIEEQKALSLLSAKLKKSGYQVTKSASKADYFLSISMDTPTYKSTYSMPVTTPSTTNYSGFANNNYYSGTATSYQTQYVPVTSTYSFKKTYIELYQYNRRTEKSRIIWLGFTSIDAKKYKRYAEQVMGAVINYLGVDYEGRVRLK